MPFKSGDKIRRKAAYEDSRFKDKVLTVDTFRPGTAWFSVKEYPKLGYAFHEDYWDLVKENEMCPHPHAALIKQWADGAKIEWWSPDEEWVEVERPGWFEAYEYRIKPEPKPDVVVYGRMKDYVQELDEYPQVTDIARFKSRHDNLKFIFDGETGKLKSAEVI